MRVLALDPGSQVVGYAVLRGLGAEDLQEGGVLRASLARSVLEKAEYPAWLKEMLYAPELTAWRRILSLVGEVEDLVMSAIAVGAQIVVEIPSGKIGTGARRGARGALTTYGFAAGCIYQACVSLRHRSVVPVTERQWTRGAGSKQKRQDGIAAFYRGYYDPQTDPGADLADAIELARWWIAGESNRGRWVGRRQEAIGKRG